MPQPWEYIYKPDERQETAPTVQQGAPVMPSPRTGPTAVPALPQGDGTAVRAFTPAPPVSGANGGVVTTPEAMPWDRSYQQPDPDWLDYAKAFAAATGRGLVDTISTLQRMTPYGAYQSAPRDIARVKNFIRGTEEELPPSLGDTNMAQVEQLTGGNINYKVDDTLGDYISTTGEFVGGSLPLLPVTGPAGLVYSAIGGVGSEFGGQLTEGTKLEPYARIIGALLAPYAAKKGYNALHRAITPYPAPEWLQKRTANLKKHGVEMTAGQKVQSPELMNRESRTAAGRELQQKSHDSLTKTVLKRITPKLDAKGKPFGPPPERLDSEGLTKIYEGLGAMFDRFAAKRPTIIDQQLLDDIDDAIRTYDTSAVGGTAKMPTQVYQMVVNNARQNGMISGADYNYWTSKLAKLARTTKDALTQEVAHKIRAAIDAAMTRTAQAAGAVDDVADIMTARAKYFEYMIAERAAGFAAVQENGNLTSGALSSAAKSISGLRNLVLGRGSNLMDLAKDSRLLNAPQGIESVIRNQSTTDFLKTISSGITSGAATGFQLGGPQGAGIGSTIGTVAGIAAPNAFNNLLATPAGQAWAGNQLLGEPAKMLPKHLYGVLNALMNQKQE